MPKIDARGETLADALHHAALRLGGVLDGASLASMPLSDVPDGLRAQVHELVYGSLRRYGWGDFILRQLMSKPPADAVLHGVLLLGLYRLDTRPDASHIVVHQAVEAAARIADGRYRALANGVLRNVLRQWEALTTAAAKDDVAAHWHPGWWLEILRKTYPENWQAIIAADNTLPPMSLRVNRRRGTIEASLAGFASSDIPAVAGADDVIRLDRPSAVERLPGFSEGRFSVQDAGAQRAAYLLDVRDGMRVLDACAAPGGKTAHLLELANLSLTAIDNDPQRLLRVDDNLERLGLQAELMCSDVGEPERWWDGKAYDRILLDAPCTASGVVRRHPDAKWLRRADDVFSFARQQKRLLEALWPLLVPGGKLLYATCSIFPRENTEQIEAFLKRHADACCLELVGATAGLPGIQLVPNDTHDGFYYAVLQKNA